VDPLAYKHPDYTPYTYVYNNPIKFIDPFVLDTFNINIDDRIINRTTVENSENHVYIISSSGEVVKTSTLVINDEGLVQFPSLGDGFSRYGTIDEGGDHYLNAETAAALFGLVTEMNQISSDFRVDFGDMSNSTGGAPGDDHKMHGGLKGFSGDCIDYRYLNGSMQSYQGQATSSQFSSLSNYMFLARSGQWGFNKNYASNKNVWNTPWQLYPNAKLIGGHNNHGHLTYIK